MNWINNVVPPKIRSLLTTRREPPDDFWRKCGGCGQMTDKKALEQNQYVFPCCNHHDRVDARSRLKMLFDNGEYTPVAVPEVPADPLKFRDGKRYTDRIKEAKSKTDLADAVLIGEGLIDGRQAVAAAQDFRFLGGSLGMAAGEAVVTAMNRAVELKVPFILFAASGGARMQEGILSLMQMPRTTIAVRRLRAARLPYIVVLTDPTTGGVTASYAMLGDIHIAEPGALICFAGPRVIEQTIREQLPEGFQRAEYLLAHGMIDAVVHRHKLRETLSRIVAILGAGTAAAQKRGKPKTNGNGKGKVNGHVNGSALEELARASNALIEPVSDDERFEVRRSDARPTGKTEAAKTKGGGASKDAG
ncbi:MAG: acetyl-CoA carboxylase carboxyltransferase subunit beta [Proteobacteria bacterium]|nr:acetyl-CoA carboxylase carboxyltransferase subunit beta [Pseudomonadota bacterium]